MTERSLTTAELPWPVPRTRRRRIAAGVAAYLALTGLFVVAGFPYDRLGPRLAAALEAAMGQRVTIGRLGLGLDWGRPQLLLGDVRLAGPGGAPLHFDRVRLRPVLSLSWLRGDPSFAVALREGAAEIDATVRLGEPLAARGRLARVPLAALPAGLLGEGLTLDGLLDADFELAALGPAPEGEIRIHVADGSLALPGLPIGVPFARLDGELALGGGSLATLRSLVLDGPLIAVTGSGSVAASPAPLAAPLDLALTLEARDPSLRQMLAAQGLPLGPDGSANLRIGGVLGRPALAPAAPDAARGPREAAGGRLVPRRVP